MLTTNVARVAYFEFWKGTKMFCYNQVSAHINIIVMQLHITFLTESETLL